MKGKPWVGGTVGDLHGHRRVVVAGFGLFGVAVAGTIAGGPADRAGFVHGLHVVAAGAAALYVLAAAAVLAGLRVMS